jgi:hypothetical protein
MFGVNKVHDIVRVNVALLTAARDGRVRTDM